MADAAGNQPRHIVIVGGGVIGATTAYFLTRHPKYDRRLHRITLLEASSVAAGASGKAGGLLGLWAYPKELVPLSYRLHRELAQEHGGDRRWGYRRLECGHVQATVRHSDLARREEEVKAAKAKSETEKAATTPSVTESAATAPPPPAPPPQKDWEKLPKQDEQAASLLTPSPLPADLDWIDRGMAESYEQMGLPGAHETAQVHPFHFTSAMVALAEERGLEVRLGAKVTKIVLGGDSNGSSGQDAVQAVEYEDRHLGDGGATATTHHIGGVTDVVVAAGPWTGVVLPRTKVEGLRAHSVVWAADVSAYAVFTDISLPPDYIPDHRRQAGERRRRHRGRVDPEIYARPFGEVYACGEPDSSVPLPATADQVACDEAQCADMVAYVGTVSAPLAAAPVKARQACYLPRHMRFGDERGPLVGPTLTRGLWVASGHTCWGIQNGPATGCLMAEMLLDGEATSSDISKFDPRVYKI